MKLIAEIGWNHMGDMQLASKMIEAAANSGASHVKFQTWSVSKLKNGPWDTDGRRQIYEKAELTEDKHHFLLSECEKNNVKFLTSCFSASDVQFISSLCSEIKVPSTEITNQEMIENIISFFQEKNDHHVYLSTGASTWKEVENTTRIFQENGIDFTLLHCVSQYPTPANMCNLRRISDLKKLHNKVGYSGHYHGIDDAIVAVELGASVVEKHFTIDNNLPGRDNKFAILPNTMKVFSDFLVTRNQMLIHQGLDHLENENDVRFNYRGRWDKK